MYALYFPPHWGSVSWLFYGGEIGVPMHGYADMYIHEYYGYEYNVFFMDNIHEYIRALVWNIHGYRRSVPR